MDKDALLKLSETLAWQEYIKFIKQWQKSKKDTFFKRKITPDLYEKQYTEFHIEQAKIQAVGELLGDLSEVIKSINNDLKRATKPKA